MTTRDPFYLTPRFIWATRVFCLPASWLLVIGIVMLVSTIARHLA